MKKPLYIFLHMPKCAGSTFTYHVHKNLNPEEYIAMYAKDFCFGEKNIGEYYLKEAVADVKKRSKIQKDKIKIIFGHGIPYGIHKYFPDREVRYITFLREPIARTISSYNFQRSRLYWPLSDTEHAYYKQFIYKHNRIMSFGLWLEKCYDKLPNLPVGVSMVTFLQELGYLQKGRVTRQSLVELRKRFWFIGLTEQFDHDILYFYNKLGIYKFYKNKNVSDKYVGSPEKYNKLVSQKNKKDALLYASISHEYTALPVGHLKIIHTITLPVTQGVEEILSTIYRLSAKLKQIIPGYEKLLITIKKSS